ncbi:hypothetical protein [Microbacterium sp. CH1]|uniref:hypothetical protein n=1 Tax=Microbacterium sp. CH1 TaxID=1770208 RepID=UPI000788E859|nr:hypothetical protein [Microbacterium sp. CH1]KYJ97178.1 hypothetical protein AUV07_02780 [Microbacterium sp. CH1]
MGDIFAFNASAMHASAVQTRSALSGVKKRGYTRVDDCGSALVAETVDFFLDLLEEELTEAEKTSEKLAKNIELTAPTSARPTMSSTTTGWASRPPAPGSD